MRIPKWLAVLFFASLALNLGVLVGYAYQSYLWAQQRKAIRAYFQNWAPDAERRFNAVLDEDRAARRTRDSLLYENRLRHGTLSYAENPDSAEVESLLDQRAQIEREKAWVEYQGGRKIQLLRPPEKRREAEKAFRRVMGMPNPDSTTARDSSGHTGR